MLIFGTMRLHINKLLLLLSILLLTGGLYGQAVISDDVVSISDSFVKAFFDEGKRTISEISVYGSDEEPLIYIVNLYPEGWILVSGNRQASPVIGFNPAGYFEFPEENIMNPAYNWLKQSTVQLADIYDNPSGTEHPGWAEAFSSEESKSSKSINPLVQVNWGQGAGWNQFCPFTTEGPDEKALVGCVAVAMAQALSVHQVPEQGTGRNTYTHDSYGVITNDFSESFYQWDLMLPDTPNEHSALLLYDCATAVDMDFGPTASSATTSDAVQALWKHFGIADNVIYALKEDYPYTEWEERIILNLESGLPVIYRGRHDDGGHAFNIDGLSANTSSNYFHINWGWEGSANGYFLLTDLSPGTRTYNLAQAAIFRIQPANAVSAEIIPDELISFYPNPASSLLRINNESGDRMTGLKIYSLSGVLLRSYGSSTEDGIIDISGLKKGVYIVEASFEDTPLQRRKIVKQ